MILRPPPLRSAADVAGLFAEPYYPGLSYYRPVTLGSFLVQRAWVGERPASFHAVNVVLAAVALLVAHALLRLPRLRIAHAPALWAATLFVLHPVASSVVMPISGRDTLLVSIFGLGALWAFCRGGRARYALGLVSLALALLCKEAAVAVPALVLLADLTGVSEDAPGRDTRAWLRRYTPIAGLLLLYFLVRAQLFGAVDHLPGSPVRFALSYLYGLQVSFAPFRELVYEPRGSVWFSPARLGLAGAGAALLALAVWRSNGPLRRRSLFFVGWFAAMQLPSANLVWQETPFAERYVFPATLAIFGLVAMCVSAHWERIPLRRAAIGLGVATLVACAALLPVRGRVWSEEAFYRQWIRHDPERVAPHYNLANLLRDRGALAEARARYEEALRLAPRHVEAHSNLGRLLIGTGELEAAMAHFEAALRLAPHNATVHNNAGGALAVAGRLHEATAHFRRAVELAPEHLGARVNLGRALLRAGARAEAVEQLRRALAIDPDHAEARALLERSGRPAPE